jgi:hypothetical protein
MNAQCNSSTPWRIFSRKSLSSAAVRRCWRQFVFRARFFKIVKQVDGDVGFQSEPSKLLHKVIQEIGGAFALH